MTERIGIAVTTRNRPAVFEHSLREIRRHLPPAARLVVVDDASQPPAAGADYRFSEQVGVARAKNKCLALLQDCEHIFLFDDDIYPIARHWYRAYIDSQAQHLMYIYPDRDPSLAGRGGPVIYDDGVLRAYLHPRGSMLYLRRACIDQLGGFDPSLGRYGYEHPNLSERIHAAGLTPFPYMDVVGSEQLLHCLDEHRQVESSVPGRVRAASIRQGRARYEALRGQAYYVPVSGREVVLTAYFTGRPDPQRGHDWPPDSAGLQPLAQSIEAHAPGVPLVVLSDSLPTGSRGIIEGVRCRQGLSPYLQRWLSIRDYLQAHREIERLWCVDATDVEMLHNPFPEMGWQLYCGSEPEKVGCPWMRAHHHGPAMEPFLARYGHRTLINPGLLGGPRRELLALVGAMLSTYQDMEHQRFYAGAAAYGALDMGLFNLVGYTQFPQQIHFGPRVHTRFKAYERSSAWWRHK